MEYKDFQIIVEENSRDRLIPPYTLIIPLFVNSTVALHVMIY